MRKSDQTSAEAQSLSLQRVACIEGCCLGTFAAAKENGNLAFIKFLCTPEYGVSAMSFISASPCHH